MSLSDYVDELDEGEREELTYGDSDDDELSDQESSLVKKANVEEFKTRFDDYGIPEVFVYIKNTLTQFEQNEPELYATMTSKLSSQESESLHNLMQVCDEAYANFEHPRPFDQDGDDDVDEYSDAPIHFNFTIIRPSHEATIREFLREYL